ncbi:hypothetical protein MRX96_045858 [Rhipicephalus microplus]
MSRRPEYSAPPELFYNEEEAEKYTSNSRIMEIQTAMSERAVELLALPDDETCLILDLGCGSGLSGDVLEEQGHVWVGVDISRAMLNVAQEREAAGDMLLGDLGQGLCFRAGGIRRLYACLGRGRRAVFQFYPENADQVELLTQQAMRAGFTGGLVVDYPNSTKAKKMFLVLFTAWQGPEERSCLDSRKKERRRRQGKETRPDSKYTGRRRCGKF